MIHDVEYSYVAMQTSAFSQYRSFLLFGSNRHHPAVSLPPPMARLRKYGDLIASPGGRSFYSNPRKCTCRAKAPITPALKEFLAKQREERRTEYYQALQGARNTIHQQATQLRESFGGHSAEYYAQEILQRGRLERVRRKPSRWNAYLRQELKIRNAGTSRLILFCGFTSQSTSPRVICRTAKTQVK